MIIRRSMIGTALAVLLAPLFLIAKPGRQFLVSSEQVVAALRTSGQYVSPNQVQLLSLVHTREPNAVLHLIHIEPWQEGMQKAEIRCVDLSACLPFFVLIEGARVPDLAVGKVPEPGMAEAGPKKYDVRKGDTAVLTIETEQSRITMRVICLENGDRGQKIRVASKDRKRSYEAEIIAPGVLKAVF